MSNRDRWLAAIILATLPLSLVVLLVLMVTVPPVQRWWSRIGGDA